MGCASASCEARPGEEQDHLESLIQQQAASHADEQCECRECADSGRRLMLSHVVQGGHPARCQGHCHGLQVNDATLQHHKMLVSQVWVGSGAWGSVRPRGGECGGGGDIWKRELFGRW